MAKKVKVEPKLVQMNSKQEVDKYLAEYAVLKNQVHARTATYNEEEQRKRDEFRQSISEQSQRMELLEQSFHQWAINNKDVYDERRTMVLTHGSLGFRFGKPGVTLISGYKSEAAMSLIQANEQWKDILIRTKTELDKTKILELHGIWEKTAEGQDLPDLWIDDDTLAKFGLQVTQSESFYVDVTDAV